MTDAPKTFGSLFAGIGGIDLGLERCGLVCKWQVEIDPYCQKVLAKHWPNVPRHDDVKTFPPDESTTWQVDMVTAGFPCQDISLAGEGKGIHGNRSSLFFDAVRIARTLKARWIFLENVPAITSGGLDVVLATLSQSGFDAEWQMLSAADVGAPHRRNRFWLRASLADATSIGSSEPGPHGQPCHPAAQETRQATQSFDGRVRHFWATEPELDRVADGLPSRVDRLKGLGNAVVPQCVEELCYQWGWNHEPERTR